MLKIPINFSELGGPIYIGWSEGTKIRKQLNLDVIETNDNVCFIVDIPETTYAMNSSFILALFGPSIDRLKSIAEFKKQYVFETHGRSYLAIERAYARAAVRYRGIID